MAPKSALAPRLSRSIRVPQPPYSSMWCPYVTPKRSERPLAAYWSVKDRIVFVMRGFGKNRSKNHGVILLPSWRWSAPMARLGPTHGTKTGSWAPIFGLMYFSMYKRCAACSINWGLRWGRNCDRHGRHGPKTPKNCTSWLDPVLKLLSCGCTVLSSTAVQRHSSG